LKTKHGPVVEYYHRGVVAHLIGFEIALPLDVELQAPGEGEQPAAMRMLQRLGQWCPRYFDVVVADGLYLEAPFVNFCREHGKHVLTTLKGDHRVLLQDARALLDLVEPQVWQTANQTVRLWDIEGFTCCEGIQEPLRVVHTEERVSVRQRVAGQWIEQEQQHTWWWATTAPASLLPGRVACQAGHARWDVENDAFNVLGTHWYLDHCFKHHPVAIENFVLTLFIAYVLLQHFYLRNCQPSVRRRLTFVALARELYAGLVAEPVQAPWPLPPAGTPP
jgi:hypothetical protein